jgi:hypothetical protein
MEHTALYDILIRNHILGYFRYVDYVLIVYDASLTNVDYVIYSFNTATSPLQFSIEKEQQRNISFLDITMY